MSTIATADDVKLKHDRYEAHRLEIRIVQHKLEHNPEESENNEEHSFGVRRLSNKTAPWLITY